MAILVKMYTDYISLMSSLLRDRFLKRRFLDLQNLQYKTRVELLSLFFKEAEKQLNKLTMSLQQQIVDFKQLNIEIHEFRSFSSIIGARRVKDAMTAFINVCLVKKLDGCMECLQLAKDEYFLVKNKIETSFRLEQQIVGTGGRIPIIP